MVVESSDNVQEGRDVSLFITLRAEYPDLRFMAWTNLQLPQLDNKIAAAFQFADERNEAFERTPECRAHVAKYPRV